MENKPTLLHEQAYERIRAHIEEGNYNQDGMLPSESELGEMLRISRGTLRRALGRLVEEGLVIRMQGVGTKVLSSFSPDLPMPEITQNKYTDYSTLAVPNRSLRREKEMEKLRMKSLFGKLIDLGVTTNLLDYLTVIPGITMEEASSMLAKAHENAALRESKIAEILDELSQLIDQGSMQVFMETDADIYAAQADIDKERSIELRLLNERT